MKARLRHGGRRGNRGSKSAGCSLAVARVALKETAEMWDSWFKHAIPSRSRVLRYRRLIARSERTSKRDHATFMRTLADYDPDDLPF